MTEQRSIPPYKTKDGREVYVFAVHPRMKAQMVAIVARDKWKKAYRQMRLERKRSG